MDEHTTQPNKNDFDAKKENIFERINKRHKEHKNYWEFQQDQRTKNTAQEEGIDYFAQSFTEQTRDIEERMKNVSSGKKAAGGDIAPADVTKQLADILQQIHDLQGYLNTSTIFLADAKIKCCQQVLNELMSSYEEARQKLLPKKKFGFSGKKVASRPKLCEVAVDKVDAPEKKQSAHVFLWTVENRKNAHICLSGDDVNGKDITISNVQHCLIELRGYAGSVQIKNATDCTFLSGPISRSLFAEQCVRCTFAVACQQLRLHTSTQLRIYLHVTCRAIIEDCKQIEIAAYNYDYDDIEGDFKRAGLDKAQNNYTDVADFNWLSPDVHSPNWSLLKDYAEPNWCELRRNFNDKSSNETVL